MRSTYFSSLLTVLSTVIASDVNPVVFANQTLPINNDNINSFSVPTNVVDVSVPTNGVENQFPLIEVRNNGTSEDRLYPSSDLPNGISEETIISGYSTPIANSFYYVCDVVAVPFKFIYESAINGSQFFYEKIFGLNQPTIETDPSKGEVIGVSAAKLFGFEYTTVLLYLLATIFVVVLIFLIAKFSSLTLHIKNVGFKQFLKDPKNEYALWNSNALSNQRKQSINFEWVTNLLREKKEENSEVSTEGKKTVPVF